MIVSVTVEVLVKRGFQLGNVKDGVRLSLMKTTKNS